MGSFSGQSSMRAGRRGRGDGDSSNPIKPLLTSKNDTVPGQVIVQLQGNATAAITESIGGNSTAFFEAGMAATSFGVTALDQALSALKVTSISRLHPPAPPIAADGVTAFAAEAAEVMGSTFRIHYSAKTAPDKVVSNLSGVSGVEFAEAVRLRETLSTTPNDPQFPTQWGLRRIHCPDAWDRTRGSNSIVVAVVDTGVDLDHPELAPLLVPGRDLVNLGPSPVAPPGFHFEGDVNIVDNDPMDEVGHGTHVAGTICCLSNNAAGVAGVTWDCRIMPVRVLARIVNNTNPSDVRGTGSSADIAAGIRWAVDHGARVINLSLGGPSDTFVERDAIAYAIAHNVVVCAAMGNGGAGGATSFPAAYPDVVAVGAIDNSDHRAVFSQVGPHIDISGPGVSILSTVWNNTFATMSGTSMATPHVAGVAALVLSIKPSLTAAQCADILRQTADPLKDNPADPIPNNNYGWGCVNALAAVNRAAPPITHTVLCQPTQPIICHNTSPVICIPQTSPIRCPPHTVLTCPSVVIACPTRTIICHQSVAIICQSHLVVCHHTLDVSCIPSHQLPCQTQPITCHPTLDVRCQVSGVVACPTGIACPPQSLACGAQSLACGAQSLACGPGGPGGPIGPGGGGLGSGLGDLDPYSGGYGDS